MVQMKSVVIGGVSRFPMPQPCCRPDLQHPFHDARLADVVVGEYRAYRISGVPCAQPVRVGSAPTTAFVCFVMQCDDASMWQGVG